MRRGAVVFFVRSARMRSRSSAAGAHLLETPLADDQETGETKDGRLRLRATVQDTEQLRWWLLSFGDKVEILKPKRLRYEFRTIVDNLASSYGGP